MSWCHDRLVFHNFHTYYFVYETGVLQPRSVLQHVWFYILNRHFSSVKNTCCKSRLHISAIKAIFEMVHWSRIRKCDYRKKRTSPQGSSVLPRIHFSACLDPWSLPKFCERAVLPLQRKKKQIIKRRHPPLPPFTVRWYQHRLPLPSTTVL